MQVLPSCRLNVIESKADTYKTVLCWHHTGHHVQRRVAHTYGCFMHVGGAYPPDVPVAVTVLPMKPYQKCSPGPTKTDP